MSMTTARSFRVEKKEAFRFFPLYCKWARQGKLFFAASYSFGNDIWQFSKEFPFFLSRRKLLRRSRLKCILDNKSASHTLGQIPKEITCHLRKYFLQPNEHCKATQKFSEFSSYIRQGKELFRAQVHVFVSRMWLGRIKASIKDAKKN